MENFYNVVTYNVKNEPLKITPISIEKQETIRYRFVVSSKSEGSQIIEQLCSQNKSANSYEITINEIKSNDFIDDNNVKYEYIITDTSNSWSFPVNED